MTFHQQAMKNCRSRATYRSEVGYHETCWRGMVPHGKTSFIKVEPANLLQLQKRSRIRKISVEHMI